MKRLLILVILIGTVFAVDAQATLDKIFKEHLSISDITKLEDNYGLKIIAMLLNESDYEYEGNLTIMVQAYNNKIIKVSKIYLAIHKSASLDSAIPIAWETKSKSCEDFDCIQQYRFTLNLSNIKNTSLEIYFSYPDNYGAEKYYYSVRIRDIVNVSARTDQRLKDELQLESVL